MAAYKSQNALHALDVARRCFEASAKHAVLGSKGFNDASRAFWRVLHAEKLHVETVEKINLLMVDVFESIADARETARQEGIDEARKEAGKSAQEYAPSKRSERRAPRFVVLLVCAVVFLTFCYLRWQGGCIVVFLTVLYVFGWREPLKTIRELPPS